MLNTQIEMTHSSEKQVKIDTSCKNKKCLDLDAFLDTIISISHLEKKKKNFIF